MDNNNTDPNNPAPLTPGLGQPAGIPPASPSGAPWQPPAQTDMPQSSPVPGMDQTQVTPPTPNPWDNPNQGASQNPSTPMADPMAPPAQIPSEPPAPPQSPWPSSTSTSGFEVPAAPAPVTSGSTPPNPMTANPFLQPQNSGSESSVPEPAGLPPASENPIPGLESEPPATPSLEQAIANPLQPPSIPLAQNPMGGAFPPADSTETPGIPEPQSPAMPEAPPPATDQPTGIDPSVPPTEGNPAAPDTGQQGTLDLSALQSGSPTSESPQSQQPGNPLPDMGPQENAPTDLSHLIAGDESHHQPGDVYAPPITQDQTPGVGPVQSPASPDGTIPPPGKHLNLTKVLLVAGIPIILIVAALSAYLILGIGKPVAPDTTNQTSLPVEQTKQQAPLTNPPQQIIAPSPVSIPEPQTQVLESSLSGTVLPGASSSPAASLSPAMQAALKKASPSPASTNLP